MGKRVRHGKAGAANTSSSTTPTAPAPPQKPPSSTPKPKEQRNERPDLILYKSGGDLANFTDYAMKEKISDEMWSKISLPGSKMKPVTWEDAKKNPNKAYCVFVFLRVHGGVALGQSPTLVVVVWKNFMAIDEDGGQMIIAQGVDVPPTSFVSPDHDEDRLIIFKCGATRLTATVLFAYFVDEAPQKGKDMLQLALLDVPRELASKVYAALE